MAKGKKIESAPVNTLETMTREELRLRYEDNVARRKELADENKTLVSLWKSAVSSEKVSATSSKIAALQARLAALTNPTVVPSDNVEPSIDTPAELAM